MITGSNSGIGYETALWLAQRGGTVHLVCRNKERGQKALDDIKEQSKNEKVYLHVCDVSVMSDIRKMVSEFVKEGHRLDVLVNNAGVMLDKREETPEGIESTLATNTVSNFLLTLLLIPTLAKSKSPRVINISSGGGLTEKLLIRKDYENINPWFGRTAYARTKRHQIVLAELFAQKFKDTNIIFTSMHPGWVDTPTLKVAMPGFYNTMQNKLRTVYQGGDTIHWLAVSPKVTLNDSGEFFRDRRKEIKHLWLASTKSTPPQNEELWNWCAELCKCDPSELTPKL